MRAHLLGAIAFLTTLGTAVADQKDPITVGVATVLSGDAAVVGANIQKTISTYNERYLRHPIKFVFEDARKGSADGLTAYKKLVQVDKADVLLGATTSNGTLAGAPIVNKSKVPLLTPVTGGSNIDHAGEFIFRIGNSDVLNGYQQADLLIARGLKRVALLTEQTDYTTDIAKFFRERFLAGGGTIILDEEFLPDTTDFRSLILKIKARKSPALFMSTQSGLAFGLFIKQFRQLRADQSVETYTNFLSANNPEARSVAGDSIYGVRYMAPAFDRGNERLQQFLVEFQRDHGTMPLITFHTAGTVDALNILQDYLDEAKVFSGDGFRKYLLTRVRGYRGAMGVYSLDEQGNSDLGFEPAQITRDAVK